MVIASVVMAILLAVAIVFIVALLCVILKQRKQPQKLTVDPPLHDTSQHIYEDVTDSANGQNIGLTGNLTRGQFNK